MKSILSLAVLLLLMSCEKKAEDTAASPAPSTASCCRIFVSATGAQGNFGGPSVADAICMADANKPSGSETYKAMLVEGTTRRACSTDNCSGGPAEHIDWVLQANTAYKRVDGTAIGTTDANGLLGIPLTNSIGSALYAWTGIEYATRWTNSINNCQTWTNNTFSFDGRAGEVAQTDDRFLDIGSPLCSDYHKFYCVEQ